MATRTDWTRQQMLVALNLYCQIPFGKLHARNPDIINLAEKIGRTPSALAMKLTNIASLDPAITSTGRKGLANASATDRAMWNEMQSDWEGFAIEAHKAASELGVDRDLEAAANDRVPVDDAVDYTGIDKAAQATVRVGQDFFRRAVLSAYDYRCCITGLALPALLVASHIVPWRVDSKNRLNPRNGVCLSALHDRSFDAGVITIGEDMTVRVSTHYSERSDRFFEAALLAYGGKPMIQPEKFPPGNEFLEYHRQYVFKG